MKKVHFCVFRNEFVYFLNNGTLYTNSYFPNKYRQSYLRIYVNSRLGTYKVNFLLIYQTFA